MWNCLLDLPSVVWNTHHCLDFTVLSTLKFESLRSEDAGVLKSRIFQPCGTGSGFVFWGDWTSAFVTLNLNLSSGRRGIPEQIPEEPQHLQHSNHQTPLNPPNSETIRGHFPGPRHRLQPKHSPQSRFVPTKAETSAWSTDVAWAPTRGRCSAAAASSWRHGRACWRWASAAEGPYWLSVAGHVALHVRTLPPGFPGHYIIARSWGGEIYTCIWLRAATCMKHAWHGQQGRKWLKGFSYWNRLDVWIVERAPYRRTGATAASSRAQSWRRIKYFKIFTQQTGGKKTTRTLRHCRQ